MRSCGGVSPVPDVVGWRLIVGRERAHADESRRLSRPWCVLFVVVLALRRAIRTRYFAGPDYVLQGAVSVGVASLLLQPFKMFVGAARVPKVDVSMVPDLPANAEVVRCVGGMGWQGMQTGRHADGSPRQTLLVFLASCVRACVRSFLLVRLHPSLHKCCLLYTSPSPRDRG